MGYRGRLPGNHRDGSKGAVTLVGSPLVPIMGDTITTVYKYELDDLGTLRARLGWLSSPNLLWYGTAGLAYGQTKLSTVCAVPACSAALL